MGHIGGMLGANNGLKELDLTNTRTTGEGCLLLAEGLKKNGCLEARARGRGGDAGAGWFGCEGGDGEGALPLGLEEGARACEPALFAACAQPPTCACLPSARSASLNPPRSPKPQYNPPKTLRQQSLLLNGNVIGEDGARHLMQALYQNRALTHLGLLARCLGPPRPPACHSLAPAPPIAALTPQQHTATPPFAPAAPPGRQSSSSLLKP